VSVSSIAERARAHLALRRLHSSVNVNWPTTLTVAVLGRSGTRCEVVMPLAELTDPTAWANTAADNERLIERCRELEVELAELKKGKGRRP
jgi:hypothetical protein